MRERRSKERGLSGAEGEDRPGREREEGKSVGGPEGDGRREAPVGGKREIGGTRGGGVETRRRDIMPYGTSIPNVAVC